MDDSGHYFKSLYTCNTFMLVGKHQVNSVFLLYKCGCIFNIHTQYSYAIRSMI